MIAPILKYEFISRGKNNRSFSNEFLIKFLQEVVSANLQVENIEKSFRKPHPFTPLYYGFEEEGSAKPNPIISQPYNSKEKLTFKYPYLRPTWEPMRDDQYYFILQMREEKAEIQVVKGKDWIGLAGDKEAYFESIVKAYLANMEETKIWISEEEPSNIE